MNRDTPGRQPATPIAFTLLLRRSGWLAVAAALNLGAASDPAAAGAAATSGTPPSGASMSDLLPDTVVARGNGFEIKRSELDRAVISSRANAAARGQDITADKLPQVELMALEYLIRVQILNHIATADDKAKGLEQSDKYYEALRKRAPSEEVMLRQIKAAGLTPESLRKGLTEEATAKIVLSSKVTVTSNDVQKFYDSNPDKFEQPEQARLGLITLGLPDPTTGLPLTENQKAEKKKQLTDLRDRARKGEDFAKLAKDYSDDPRAKTGTTEITISRGNPNLPPQLESAAFSLQTNQISDVITTDVGFVLVKMIQKKPAGKVAFEEASADIRDYLESVEIKKMLPKYEAQLRKDTGVEILDKKLKALEDSLPPEQTSPGVTQPGGAVPAAGAN